MTSSILEMLDAALEHIVTTRPLGYVGLNHAPVSEEDITIVMASATGRIVINCSDISLCDSERHVLRDSTYKDSDDDDVRVDQGVSLPIGRKS